MSKGDWAVLISTLQACIAATALWRTAVVNRRSKEMQLDRLLAAYQCVVSVDDECVRVQLQNELGDPLRFQVPAPGSEWTQVPPRQDRFIEVADRAELGRTGLLVVVADLHGLTSHSYFLSAMQMKSLCEDGGEEILSAPQRRYHRGARRGATVGSAASWNEYLRVMRELGD